MAVEVVWDKDADYEFICFCKHPDNDKCLIVYKKNKNSLTNLTRYFTQYDKFVGRTADMREAHNRFYFKEIKPKRKKV